MYIHCVINLLIVLCMSMLNKKTNNIIFNWKNSSIIRQFSFINSFINNQLHSFNSSSTENPYNPVPVKTISQLIQLMYGTILTTNLWLNACFKVMHLTYFSYCSSYAKCYCTFQFSFLQVKIVDPRLTHVDTWHQL